MVKKISLTLFSIVITLLTYNSYSIINKDNLCRYNKKILMKKNLTAGFFLDEKEINSNYQFKAKKKQFQNSEMSYQYKTDILSEIELDSVAPDFRGTTPNGKEIIFSESLGKLTLIQFWASWCRPCKFKNLSLREIYLKYKDKGFQVVGVSLDKPHQKDEWIKAIKEDYLDWLHISNLMFWNDPIALKYNVRVIPQNFLIDDKGKIIAKDLSDSDLIKRIKKYLEN